jgi:hypothetical protein
VCRTCSRNNVRLKKETPQRRPAPCSVHSLGPPADQSVHHGSALPPACLHFHPSIVTGIVSSARLRAFVTHLTPSLHICGRPCLSIPVPVHRVWFLLHHSSPPSTLPLSLPHRSLPPSPSPSIPPCLPPFNQYSLASPVLIPVASSFPQNKQPPATMKLMKLFKRRKQRNKSEAPGADVFGKKYRQFGGSMPAQPHFLTEDDYPLPGPIRPFSPNRASAARLAALPAPVLERIFAFVCPHTQDCSYETQEQSSLEDACMLCDTRDLSHCALVNRRWSKTAPKVLYVLCRVPICSAIPFCQTRVKERRQCLVRGGHVLTLFPATPQLP